MKTAAVYLEANILQLQLWWDHVPGRRRGSYVKDHVLIKRLHVASIEVLLRLQGYTGPNGLVWNLLEEPETRPILAHFRDPCCGSTGRSAVILQRHHLS